MIKKAFYLFILVSLVVNLYSVSEVGAYRPEVAISASTLRPGDFFWLKVSAPPEVKVKARLLGSELLLHYYDNAFWSLVPVSYWTGPGTYVLTVELTNNTGGYIRKELPIQVVVRSFPEQRIRVPETVRKKALAPENVDMDKVKIQKARKIAEQNPHPPLWKDKFIWPVRGRITTDFGFVRYVNDMANGRHSGLDIAAPKGTPVAAVNCGRVILAEELHWTGLTVIVYHGLNLYSSYSHLSEIAVKAGEEVQSGSLIGKVGATGLATGPHLHLTFKIGDTAVDPYLFLERELSY